MDDNNKLNTIWQEPPSQPVLANNQVHIWRANLDLPTDKIEQLATSLSTDEMARANKFYYLKHKNRFIAARVILRLLLANYLQINPEKIEFEYSNRGKPRLAASIDNSSLQFNVSHSQEYALYGFTNHHLIGVDVEYLREMANITELARRFFTHREFHQLIADLTGREQEVAFYQLWTAKEAYLKAIGTGLSGSLSDIELSLDDRNLKLLAIKGNIATVGKWSMYHFIPAANYVAAIMVNTQIPKQQINFWDW
ncbi:4'-phosphopantetheinyl transferase superfamily protein [Pleurocapsa sp. PCC 7319]|uniref:4'-phosphopantetheinyl transferase family protein n=1 Tax=Pleurocapsa sp. PCC 7319 TaxID=118161 RepID=UPI00034986F0|nr:4'-phosphopantetheinyl transferase superfamily protein [Pleurocapsa sp. PCC 7319]